MALSITEACVSCTACEIVCPEEAVQAAKPHFTIDARRCTECEGNYADSQCASICPVEGAIVDAAGEPINPPGSLTGIPPVSPGTGGIPTPVGNGGGEKLAAA